MLVMLDDAEITIPDNLEDYGIDWFQMGRGRIAFFDANDKEIHVWTKPMGSGPFVISLPAPQQ